MSKLENKIENYFVKKAKENQCLCYKFISPSNRGVPDRILITPDGITHYVELKSETGKLSALQKKIIKSLLMQNAPIYVINSNIGTDRLFEYLSNSKTNMPDIINPAIHLTT